MSAARLVLSKGVVRPGEEITHTIVNDGEDTLTFGIDYSIEEQIDDGSWRPLNLNIRFAAKGLLLYPGRSSYPIWTGIPSNLPPGRYRLTKSGGALGPDHLPSPDSSAVWVYSEFSVESPRN